jgi:hypothetical protein
MTFIAVAVLLGVALPLRRVSVDVLGSRCSGSRQDGYNGNDEHEADTEPTILIKVLMFHISFTEYCPAALNRPRAGRFDMRSRNRCRVGIGVAADVMLIELCNACRNLLAERREVAA